ncbi:MAG: hypothetical protein R3F37_20510 [Candidatus Competibacteraceae bacterium]
MGLSVSHGIIHAHGGTITVDVPACGGTLFEIRLPREGTGELEAQQPVINVKPDDRRILIVDDVVEIAQMLSEILSEAGYHIEIAENGQAALKNSTNDASISSSAIYACRNWTVRDCTRS